MRKNYINRKSKERDLFEKESKWKYKHTYELIYAAATNSAILLGINPTGVERGNIPFRGKKEVVKL